MAVDTFVKPSDVVSFGRMILRDRLREMREVIARTAASSGARNVRVFGSVARGEDSDASDIDFLVTLDSGRTLLDLARLEERLEKLLGRRVDVVTEEALQEPIRSAALREAIRV
jgi:predicted nucleotidyltransferase